MNGETPIIGESSKVRSMLDIFSIVKIISLVIGLLGFLFAAFAAWPIIYSIWGGVLESIYFIGMAIVNLMFYTKVDEFSGMVKSRRYRELQESIFLWIVLTLIFGVIVGILLIIVYIYLNDLKNAIVYHSESQENPPVPPPPPE